MGARIPPDFILLCCGILMWLSATYLPQFGFNAPYRFVVAGATLLCGLVIIFSAKAALARHRTTERPDRRSLLRATTLVTNGIYNHSRNPIYLGMTILLGGWWLFLMNWISIGGLFVFVGLLTKFQILPEEKALERIFGADYRRYRSRVRRWI